MHRLMIAHGHRFGDQGRSSGRMWFFGHRSTGAGRAAGKRSTLANDGIDADPAGLRSPAEAHCYDRKRLDKR